MTKRDEQPKRPVAQPRPAYLEEGKEIGDLVRERDPELHAALVKMDAAIRERLARRRGAA